MVMGRKRREKSKNRDKDAEGHKRDEDNEQESGSGSSGSLPGHCFADHLDLELQTQSNLCFFFQLFLIP